jgi:hypothetical protein
VIDAAKRFTKPDFSCDVPKGDNNWDNVILNPLNMPTFPCLFQYDRATGGISVNPTACQQAAIDIGKAQATVDKLCLDAARLRDLRKPVLDQVNDQIRHLVALGYTPEQARSRLAQALLRQDANNHWPAFFSAIRSYLGAAAEEQLQAINYNG